MSPIWEFFKKVYEDAYDLPHFYLGIENELYCHVFTIFFFLSLFTSIALIIKLMIGRKEDRKKKKEWKRRMEKSLLGVLEEKDKNKKEKNI